MRARLHGAFAALLLSLGACQLFVSFDDPGSPATAEAGSDASAFDAGADAPSDPCMHRLPPAPPAAPSDGGLNEGEFLTFAVKTIRFLPPTGYDLDGLCTGDTRSPTGRTACAPVEGGTARPDYDGGVDDAFGAIAGGLKFGNMDPAATAVNLRIEQGETLLLTLTSYNGGADDPYVQLGAARSHNVQTTVFQNMEVDGSVVDGGFLYPAWDGNDHWGVPSNVVTVKAMDNEIVPTELWDGYVVNHVLVVRPTRSIAVAIGADADLHAPWITATIDLSGPLPVLRDGMMAGRVAPDQLIQAVGRFNLYTTPGVPVPLCDPSTVGLYQMLAGQLCATPDIPLDPARDGKSDTCNGISVTIGFEAWRAHLGAVGLDGTPEPCAPGSLITSCATDMDASSDAATDQ